MKLLLLDDDLFLRDMYATKFKEAGHEVVVAEDGQTALSKLKDGGFDVVLLDMVMPTMTGVEFLQQAKAISNTSKTRFIVLSNQGEDSDKSAAKEAGANGYIIKAESIPSDVVSKVENFIKT